MLGVIYAYSMHYDRNRPVVAWTRVCSTLQMVAKVLFGVRELFNILIVMVFILSVYTCQNIHIRYVQFYVNYVSLVLILKEEK